MSLEFYLSSAPGATAGAKVSVQGNQVSLSEPFPPDKVVDQRTFATPTGYTGDRFLGGTFHGKTTAPCIVVCSDSTQGTNCVICQEAGIIARVCC